MQALDAAANERAGRGHGDTGRLARHRQQAAVGNRRESLIDIADDRSHWRKILRLGAGGECKESRSRGAPSRPGYDKRVLEIVTTGLDPVVHTHCDQANARWYALGMLCCRMDCRIKSGNDERER